VRPFAGNDNRRSLASRGEGENHQDVFHEASRELQDRFDTRRIADRINDVLVHETITPTDAAFISQRDMFFLATTDASGQPTCSYKGGDTGFVRVVDDHTLAFPNYDGNGMYLSMGNLAQHPQVGLLFIDLVHGNRLRVHGQATLVYDDPLLQEFQEAQFLVTVRVSAVFPNCPRYIHRYQQVERSSFVPREGRRTPVPDWKRSEWAHDALPEGDTASVPVDNT
jgi:predicted pyridoxine 5'-phosphate oxidase superfamily flavin-nucleotide-binding protein